MTHRQQAIAHITFSYDPTQGSDLDAMADEFHSVLGSQWPDIEVETVGVQEDDG